MAARQSLGRGFDVLIPTNLDSSILEEDKNRVQKLLITDIVSNPDQPRREFNEGPHKELTASITRHGVLQPIIVVRESVGKGYRIVAGERRWRAAKAANLTHIPVIIRSLKELEEVELALIENIQRVDLSPLDQALSVYRLQHQFNLALDQIAEKLGKAPSTLSNLTRLLQLPDSARQALAEGKISEGHARAILAIKDQVQQQEELLRSILDNGWTVRQAEQFANAAKKGASTVKARTATASETELTKQLGEKLGASVKLRHTANGGQLIIQYNSEDDLQRIIDKFN
ncbi:MAG: ParB/RepB/Spo0J family partition protein [Candidatus Saccharimonadales bacterium]